MRVDWCVCVVVVSYQEYSLTLSAVRVRCFDTDIDSRNAVVKLNETRNAICLAFLNACDSAVAPLDDLAQLAELDLNAQRRDR